MNKLKVLKLAEYTPAVEEVMSLSDRVKTLPLKSKLRYAFDRVKNALTDRLIYAQTTFETGDIDVEILDKLITHGDEILALYRWVYGNEYEMTEKLLGVKKVLSKIVPPVKATHLYRGVGSREGQQSFGLSVKKRILRDALIEVDGSSLKVGSEFTVNGVEHPLSFTTNLDNARQFGGVVFSVKQSDIEQDVIHITKEVVMAMKIVEYTAVRKLDPALIDRMLTKSILSSYDEVLLLPTNKSFTVKVVSLR